MGNIRLSGFTAKTAPVGADIIYLGDSANSFLESKTTISQIIANNAIATYSGTITSSMLTVWNSSTGITGAPILVDHSGNLTFVGTINGITLSDLLISVNNLDDLDNAATARTNLGLGTAAIKGASSNTPTLSSVSGSTIVNNIAIFSDTFGTIKDGGALSGFLLAANNLSDVSNFTTAFDNISPLAVKGDLLTFNGTNNIRHGVGTNGYVLTADSTQPDGVNWLPSPSSPAFVDNAIFASINGVAATTSPANVPLDTVISSTSGNTWITNGDGTGMKCQQNGSYLFTGTIPIIHTGASSGYIYLSFTKNGVAVTPNVPFFVTALACVLPIPLQSFISCISGDVIALQIISAAGASNYGVASVTTTGARYAALVSIVRLT